MTYRSTTIASVIAVLSLFTLTSCDILDTGEDHVNEVYMNFQTTESTVEAGGNTIEVDNVKLMLGNFVFLQPNFVPERDTVLVDSVEFQDKFPRVVSFSPEGTRFELGQLELGNYFSSRFELQPPSGGVSDSDLGSDYSFIIDGTYNGNSFSLRLNTDTTATKTIFPQSLLMNEQTATVNLDFTINTESMFKRTAGRLHDPTLDTTATILSNELLRYIKLQEGSRTLREYQELR